MRAAGSPEVPSNEVGLAILGPLRDLDEVAYLRFASVYRSFSSADDFEREIEALRAHRGVSPRADARSVESPDAVVDDATRDLHPAVRTPPRAQL